MRYGIVADIHEDSRRLKTALKELKARKIERLVFLGDVIDPDSIKTESIEMLMEEKPLSVMGNHDELALKCNYILIPAKYRNWIENLPEELVIDERILLTHANPLTRAKEGKGRWYSGSYIRDDDDAKEVFENCNHDIIIVGHTHIPKVFWQNGSKEFPKSESFELNKKERYILNPGAVGYTRDENPAISCAVFDTDNLLFEILRLKEEEK